MKFVALVSRFTIRRAHLTSVNFVITSHVRRQIPHPTRTQPPMPHRRETKRYIATALSRPLPLRPNLCPVHGPADPDSRPSRQPTRQPASIFVFVCVHECVQSRSAPSRVLSTSSPALSLPRRCPRAFSMRAPCVFRAQPHSELIVGENLPWAKRGLRTCAIAASCVLRPAPCVLHAASRVLHRACCIVRAASCV